MVQPHSKEQGFTLVELIIVIAIIGILAAIAIPNFASKRLRANNATAQADLKNAMTFQEAYFVDNSRYTGDFGRLSGAGYITSSNIVLSLTGSTSGFTMTAYHTGGSATWTVRGPGANIGLAS